MALHNLRMIIVGCPACFDNTPDGRDAHPTKQLKAFCNYATPNKGVAQFEDDCCGVSRLL
jgi:hypothetical protein